MDRIENTIKLFDQFAETYQEKYMDVTLYAASLNLFLNYIESSDPSILDIACGPGNITKYLLDNSSKLEILGIDLSPQMINFAKKNNPKAEFKVHDIRNINLLNQKFDAAVMAFALPYLSKEEVISFINDCSGILNESGVLYLSTMEDEHEKSGLEGPGNKDGQKMYIHYYEAAFIKDTLIKSGFEILYSQRQNFPLKTNITWKDLIIIARKKA